MKGLTGLVVLGVALFPAVASAEVTVTILGLRSATADEQVAGQVTDALREAAAGAQSSGLSHTGRENQLSQLLVVFDCTDPTTRCMREIGRSLGSQRLVYGLLEPESGRSDSDYAVTLRYFNVESGEIERDLRERIPRAASTREIGERARRFLMAVSGTAIRGALAVTCNVEGAQVLIGDREIGTTTQEPLVIDDLEPGDVAIEIRHDEYATFRRTVTIEAGQTQALDVELGEADGGSTGTADGTGGTGSDWLEPTPDDGRRSLAWLGWTMIGVGAVFGGLGLWASLRVNSAALDERLQENFNRGTDICDAEPLAPGVINPEAYEQSEANDICNPATTFEWLQAVFYPLAATAAVVGIWLVVREMRRDREQEARRLNIIPVAFNNGGAVTATLNF